MVTKEQIEQAKRIPLPSLLPADTKLVKKGANKFMAMCSFHEEVTPSMSLVQYPDGAWGYKCFGCGAAGDPIRYLSQTKGLDFIDSVKELCEAAKTAPLRPSIEATYDYYDREGVLLYQVVRYAPKNFRVRRPTETGWAWCLDGLKRVLYRLPNLLANQDEPIYYVEGEKDVETLRKQGLLATTHAGGANAFRPELLDSLPVHSRLVVVPDRDEPGMAMMRKVFAAARERKHDVGFLILPRHKDATEWFDAGETLQDFLKEVR